MKTPLVILFAFAVLLALSVARAAAPAAGAATPPAAAAPAASALQVTVKCDQAEYRHGEPGVRYLIAPTGRLKATLTVKNTSAQPQALQFMSTQTHDFVIRDAKGAVVKRWSDGRAFGEILQTIMLKPGEERTFSEDVPLGGVATPLPLGSYTLEGILATAARPSASAAFKIVAPPP